MRNALAALVLVVLGGALIVAMRRAAAGQAVQLEPEWVESIAAPLEAITDTAESVVSAIVSNFVPWKYPPQGEPYRALIEAAERAAGMPDTMLARQLWQESRFIPNAVNRVSGAKGMAQFMDATWAEWGGGGDVFNPAHAIPAAGRYMRWLYNRHGTWLLALAAYNWGTGYVQRRGIEQAPQETVDYYTQILGDLGLG